MAKAIPGFICPNVYPELYSNKSCLKNYVFEKQQLIEEKLVVKGIKSVTVYKGQIPRRLKKIW